MDLCRQGANQQAHICLTKSAEDESFIKRLIFSIARAIGMTAVQLTDFAEDAVMLTKSETIKDAMTKSFESILADESLSEEERKEMIQKNVNDFYQDVEELTKSNVEKETQNQEEESEEKELNMDVEKMSPEDRTDFETLMKKYSQTSENEEVNKGGETKEAEQLNSEMKKAIQEIHEVKNELQELKKQYEMSCLEEIAKKYEVIGKDRHALAQRLYQLKKNSVSTYNDYIALLDEQMEITEKSGIFKEIGSSRAGSSADQELNQRIQEIQKSDTSISYEAAYVKACEETGKGLC